VIKVLLSERIQKTAAKLPPDLRKKASQAISKVAGAFGGPHQHRGLGLRKLARRSYEIRVHLQWRVVFIHDGTSLIAYDVMNHDEVVLWLRGRPKS
jgi:mRNA-degrading endonuclease RelE of RelBE toxin-antitoxin system